jgi:hypothetical protein
MPSLDARVRDVGRRERRNHHAHHPRPAKPKHNFAWLVLNLMLLTGGCSLFGAAIHYYLLGQEYEAKNSPDSVDRARNDYLHTMLYTTLGVAPLALGILSEVKRKKPRPPRVRRKRHTPTDLDS